MNSHEILQSYFKRKKLSNPSYSLRALARDLEVSPAFVSNMFNGKKAVPIQTLDKLCKVLEVDQFDVVSLKDALTSEFLKSKNILPKSVSEKPKQTHWNTVSKKFNSFLNPWYLPAILDLSTCSDFKMDPEFIGKRLGIDANTAQYALKFLIEKKLLVRSGKAYRKFQNKVKVPSKESQKEVRKYHSEMIKKAYEELSKNTDQESFDKRLITGGTIAVNPKKLEAAKKILHDALQEALELLTEGDCTEVYQLNVQLFPLTK